MDDGKTITQLQWEASSDLRRSRFIRHKLSNRKTYPYSVYGVAKFYGCSPQAAGRIVNGHARSKKLQHLIAQLIHVPFNWLWSGIFDDDERKPQRGGEKR